MPHRVVTGKKFVLDLAPYKGRHLLCFAKDSVLYRRGASMNIQLKVVSQHFNDHTG